MMVAVFGGTYAPTTISHLAGIRYLVQKKEFDHVYVVPALGHVDKGDLASSYFHRINMLEEALSEDPFKTWMEKGILVISPFERRLLREQTSPFLTIQLLRSMRKWFEGQCREPVSLRFAIGPDIDPNGWEGGKEIFNEYGFVHLPDFGGHAIDVRKSILAGTDYWRTQVTPAVARYIEMHNLYR